MRKLYYFSKADLSFKSVGGGKLSAVIVIVMLAASILTMVSGYFGVDLFGLKSLRADSMARENSILRAQLASLNRQLGSFQTVMKTLGQSDEQLRTTVNLPPIPDDMRKAAVGGVEMNTDYGVSSDANELIANAAGTLDALERQSKLQSQSYAEIMNKYQNNQKLFAHIPAIDPIHGGIVTDGFGMRYHPILRMRLMHEGIDIVADVGTDVYATGDGTVSYVGPRGGYGSVVEIDHGFGYTTLYGHLSKPLVHEGQKIKRGQVIALTGDTGLSTGPHLHYEVMKNGVHVDPTAYFFSGKEYNEAVPYNTAN
ncbi:MAG TPA: M23 family metallopeptidase [Candidatus Acidoferrales bacterium]|nr:M23 family metallopeptidase [Candidatus Acidoferrales bacterium]